jgi:hypothetical protein
LYDIGPELNLVILARAEEKGWDGLTKTVIGIQPFCVPGLPFVNAVLKITTGLRINHPVGSSNHYQITDSQSVGDRQKRLVSCRHQPVKTLPQVNSGEGEHSMLTSVAKIIPA